MCPDPVIPPQKKDPSGEQAPAATNLGDPAVSNVNRLSVPPGGAGFALAKEGDVTFLRARPERLALVERLIVYAESSDFAGKLGNGVKIEKAHFIRIMGSVVLGLSVSGKDNANLGEYSLVAKFDNPEFGRQLERFGSPEQRFAKAAWATKGLLESRVLMPAITAVGDCTDAGVLHHWLVQEKINGLEGKHLPPTVQKSDKLWEAVGRAALQLQKLTPEGYGHKFDPGTGRFEQTWVEYLAEEVAKIDLWKVVVECSLSDRSVAPMRERLARLSTLAERYPCAVNHLDLNPDHNVFFDPTTINDEVVRTCGIIDFDSSAALPGAVFEVAYQFNRPLLYGESRTGAERFSKAMGFRNSPADAAFWQDVEAAQTLLLLQIATYALNGRVEDRSQRQIAGICRFLNGLKGNLRQS